jgi:integrase
MLQTRPYKDREPLFVGQRGSLTVPSVVRLVKAWCKAINLQGNFGSHTLRKTWGYHQRVSFGTDIPRLMICFNHSSQRQTLDYLCIQPEEIKNVYENEL